jgi:hypothetical protein
MSDSPSRKTLRTQHSKNRKSKEMSNTISKIIVAAAIAATASIQRNPCAAPC